MSEKRQLNVLYTNIGRGHPFYLDGVVDVLRSEYSDAVQLNCVDVFGLSRSLSCALWKAIRYLYVAGSQGGWIGGLYEGLRKGRRKSKFGIVERLLAGGIRRYLRENRHPTLVAHPVLVPMVSDIVPVFYQHGEIALPDEAVVSGMKTIYVPLKNHENRLVQSGVAPDSIMVTGLCIETGLAKKAADCMNQRLSRLNEKDVLTGAFFSSGAEPVEHVRKITAALESLIKAGQKAVVFCRKGGNLEKTLAHRLRLKITTELSDLSDLTNMTEEEDVFAVQFNNREGESCRAIYLFDNFDYIVAPSHERTNWAAGLGLPMFILHPIIGTFSPLNREFLLDNKVAIDIDTGAKAARFASILAGAARSGLLSAMAQNGFGRYSINGFEALSRHLVAYLMSSM
jgi:hypothetical protein